MTTRKSHTHLGGSMLPPPYLKQLLDINYFDQSVFEECKKMDIGQESTFYSQNAKIWIKKIIHKDIPVFEYELDMF
jgi:hypothetical protein